MNRIGGLVPCLVAVVPLLACSLSHAQEEWHFILPEQRHLEIRSPSQLPPARMPEMPTPRTVIAPQAASIRNLSLDEAVRVALENTRVIRVLAGVGVTNSGRTIYGPAITNTQIDQARARFDPQLQIQNNFSQQDRPQALALRDQFGNSIPPGAVISGAPVDNYQFGLGLSKTTITGGAAELGVQSNTSRVHTGPLLDLSPTAIDQFPLNPQTNSSANLRYTQPLLQGAGVRANLAPIVIARIDTERSFFQTKEAMQEMVRGVIEAYWALVVARVDAWARRQQVDESEWGYQRERERVAQGFSSLGDREQARAAMESFRAALIGAEANILQREAALRNLMGLLPSDANQLVPVTPFFSDPLRTDWNELVSLAEEQRPDLVELKLVLEADQQRILIARNQAQARLDASALYRWNGLEGRTPDRTLISSEPGAFGEWELGVNFSLPLGLRQGRAQLRQAELVLMQDRANLDEGLLNAAHLLAGSLRNLAQAYAQYEAYGRARQAGWDNLLQQREAVLAGQPGRGRDTAYLDFLQAISNWGNAVNGQAQALGQYNIELANLERQTGTILETHGVRFLEERYCSIGPLGRCGPERPYPADSRPSPNADRYPGGTQPSEQSLELVPPSIPRRAPPRGPEAGQPSRSSEGRSE